MSTHKGPRLIRLVRCAQVGTIASCRMVVGDSFLVEFECTADTAKAFQGMLGNAIATHIIPSGSVSPSMWEELTRPLPADGKAAGPGLPGTEGGAS